MFGGTPAKGPNPLKFSAETRDTENPPENRFFAPGFLCLSGLRLGYTENSSFPYTPNVVALTPAALLLLIAGIRKRVPFRIP